MSAYPAIRQRYSLLEICKRPELAGVVTVFRPDVPEIYANVNTDKVYKLGMNVKDVYDTLQALLETIGRPAAA